MIREVAPDWPPRWGGRPGGGAPALVTVTGGSHLLGFCFMCLLDYSFYICDRFSLCNYDMWASFGIS
jgi:hypothetical protein